MTHYKSRDSVSDDTCPKCNADLQGKPIPEKSRRWYGDKTHFSRRIGIYDQRRDRTVEWMCPDCGHRWHR